MRTALRVFSVAVILSLPIVYSSCGDGGGGGTGPDPVPAETLASFELTVPDSIAEGEAFSLTVKAVGNRGTKPLTSYSGSVALSTTLGTVAPSSVAVTGGTVTAQVTLSDPGQQTLMASGGGRTGSVGLAVTDLPDPTILGDPNATLEQAVQDSTFRPSADDYSNDHPDLPGIYLSHNTMLLAFQVGTVVEEANAALEPIGAELVGANAGVPGIAPPILFLKLPTTSHAELEQALVTLKADARVLHVVQDVLLEEDAIPDDEKTEPGWKWEIDPNGGNWGLELSRVPQMWNLNRAVQKSLAATGLSFSTGVLDTGFAEKHEDLTYENLTPGTVGAHGTHVAGTIGAEFGNPKGIDGINPFADLVVQAGQFSAPGAAPVAKRRSYGEGMINGLISLILSRPRIMVVNASLGYNWHLIPIDTNGSSPISQSARDLAAEQGNFMVLANLIMGSFRPLPIIVTSAGNGSSEALPDQQAKYGSPMCYAALTPALNTWNIIVVESVSNTPGSAGGATRSSYSNIGGNISAPGYGILSTVPGSPAYVLKNGTSMAAPHVAGLIGYMLAVDPTLTIPQIRTALFNTKVSVGGGASGRMDAWAAVMDIDNVQETDRVLKMMLDIDDGTPDGNQRVDYDDSPDFKDFDEDDVDEDGGLGDGKVDMSDFRVWRDWILLLEDDNDLALDGELDHLKHDVNDNKVVELPADEGIFPRGDFNGDGVLSEDALAFVPGGIHDEVTDLDVFKEGFDDPDYEEEDLDELVHSVDIRVDASTVFDLMGAPSVEVWILDGGGPPPPWTYPVIESRTIFPDSPEQVFTVPHTPDGVRVEIDVGPTLSFGTDGEQVGKELGGDISVRPIYGAKLPPKATYTSTCDDPGAQDAVPIVLADWGIEPGDIVIIDQEGFYKLWEGGPLSDQLQAVFSTSDEIEKEFIDLPPDKEGDPPKLLVRRTVTGAIEAGNNVYTEPPYSCKDQSADISEDFSITPHAVFEVPDGATHLFIAPRDIFYEDNQQELEDPLEVTISAIYAPEWEARINRVSGGR